METEDIKVHDKILAFIDIGMIIIGLKKNRSYTVIREEREVVRLGESVFKKGYFQPKAMKKAITVCRTFVEVANAFSADEIIAYATCATRESKNQSEFIEALHTQASLNVRVVSGTEEARLVYLGVSNGTHIENTTTMFIDIGGGSTEIALGNQYQYQNLETLGIGSLRLTSMFLKDGGKAPVSLEIKQQIKGYVKNKTLRAIERLQQQPIELCIG
ncbi:MAG: Ppx/GppA family phosphatase, partial [Candidatus Thermoplasmatota archaeon]|nr:Ppx/GppA family phosphatase [Candidatus Thermoplasmatota archaeon]